MSWLTVETGAYYDTLCYYLWDVPRLVRRPIRVGMVPVKSHRVKSKETNLVSLPISSGRGPTISFPSISSRAVEKNRGDPNQVSTIFWHYKQQTKLFATKHPTIIYTHSRTLTREKSLWAEFQSKNCWTSLD